MKKPIFENNAMLIAKYSLYIKQKQNFNARIESVGITTQELFVLDLITIRAFAKYTGVNFYETLKNIEPFALEVAEGVEKMKREKK